jgi:hypothetical protein
MLALFHFAGAVVCIVGQRHKHFRFPFEVFITASINLLMGAQCMVVASKHSFPLWLTIAEVALTLLRTVLRLVTMFVDALLQEMYDRSISDILVRGFTTSDDDESHLHTASHNNRGAAALDRIGMEMSFLPHPPPPRRYGDRFGDGANGALLSDERTIPLGEEAGHDAVAEEDPFRGYDVDGDDDDVATTLRMLTLLDDGVVDGDRIYLDLLDKAQEAAGSDSEGGLDGFIEEAVTQW